MPLKSEFCDIVRGTGPIVAAAVHAGHELRPAIAADLVLNEECRLREEDPFTDAWTEIVDTRIVVHRSRFEVDLNRPREQAVYTTPADAWGLHLRDRPLSPGATAQSLALYDRFYERVRALLQEIEDRHGRFVVLDLHAYCHRRDGPAAPPAAAAGNPDVNVGTGSMNRERWGRLVDRFIADLRSVDVRGRALDVRENVRFTGGWFSRWIHEHFPATGCCLAVEIKKFFMDEWTGRANDAAIDAIRQALAATLPGLREETARHA